MKLKKCLIIFVIGGSRSGAAGIHPPQWDPILSFSHTFLPKSNGQRSALPQQIGPLWEIQDLPLFVLPK